MAHKHNAKLLDGRKRQAIITALANGESKRSIARRLNVSNHTVDAVGAVEWQQVATRKERIVAQAELNATLAAEQITEHLQSGKQPINVLVPVFGVSVDKLALLSNDLLNVQIAHAHTLSQDVYTQMADLAAKLNARPKVDKVVESSPTQASLPNRENVPDSGVETRLIE